MQNQNSELRMIPASQIKFSNKNPRKSIDEKSITELASSIQHQSLLQPVLLLQEDENVENYTVIAGERRVRACRKIDEEYDVKAIVYNNLDDKMIQEIGIIENLQRSDISPLEESQAFNNLLGEGYTVESIANQIGKSKYYVAPRIHLLELIDEFKEYLQSGDLYIGQAIEIAKHNKEIQSNIFERIYKRYGGVEFPTLKELQKRIPELIYKDLSNAPFSITDEDLIPEVPACVNCPKNTACHSLLFQDTSGMCMDWACFGDKRVASLKRKVYQIKNEDPDTLFFNESYYQDNKLIKDLKNEGCIVVMRSDYRIIEKPIQPIKPTRDSIKEEWEYDSEEEVDEALESAMEEYDFDIEQYHDDVKEYEEDSNSKLARKAIIVQSYNEDNIGKEILVIPTDSKSASSTDTHNGSEEASREVIKLQIKELQEKQKRNKELAFEKTYSDLTESFEWETFTKDTEDLNKAEINALLVILSKSIRYHGSSISDFFDLGKNWRKKYYSIDTINEMNPGQVNRFLRSVIQNNLQHVSLGLNTDSENYSWAKAFNLIVSERDPDLLNSIKEEYDSVYNKRNEKVLDRITELKEQMMENA